MLSLSASRSSAAAVHLLLLLLLLLAHWSRLPLTAAAAASRCHEAWVDAAELTLPAEGSGGGGAAEDGARRQRSFVGVYARQSPRERTTGTLVHVIDGDGRHTACTSNFVNAPTDTSAVGEAQTLAEGNGDDLSGRRRAWIALVQRGGCTFETKVRHAVINHGAAGVVVYNNENLDADAVMLLNGLTAVAVLVTNDDGRVLISWLEKSSAAEVEVQIGPEAEARDTNARLDPLTIVLTAATTLAAACLNAAVLVAFCRDQRSSRGGGSGDRSSERSPRKLLLANLAIANLLMCALSAAIVALMYETLHDPCPRDIAAADEARSASRCAAVAASLLWNVVIYSRMCALLLLAAEQFIACHRRLRCGILMTRRSVTMAIAISWAAACMPDAAVLTRHWLSARSYATSAGVCGTLDTLGALSGEDERVVASLLVALMTTVFVALLASGVYAARRICGPGAAAAAAEPASPVEAEERLAAVVTSLLLTLSFAASHALTFATQVAVLVDHYVGLAALRSLIGVVQAYPTIVLLYDYVLTGVPGAILDPMIYLIRSGESVPLVSAGLLNDGGSEDRLRLQHRDAAAEEASENVRSTDGATTRLSDEWM